MVVVVVVVMMVVVMLVVMIIVRWSSGSPRPSVWPPVGLYTPHTSLTDGAHGQTMAIMMMLVVVMVVVVVVRWWR